jgi:hypothetical protein
MFPEYSPTCTPSCFKAPIHMEPACLCSAISCNDRVLRWYAWDPYDENTSALACTQTHAKRAKTRRGQQAGARV